MGSCLSSDWAPPPAEGKHCSSSSVHSASDRYPGLWSNPISCQSHLCCICTMCWTCIPCNAMVCIWAIIAMISLAEKALSCFPVNIIIHLCWDEQRIQILLLKFPYELFHLSSGVEPYTWVLKGKCRCLSSSTNTVSLYFLHHMSVYQIEIF